MLLACSGATHAQSAAWRPDKPIEIIAPASPGGLHDLTARSMQRVLQARKLVETPSIVVNKGGAGGTVGWNYLAQHPGDGHYISLSAVNLLSNHIMGASTLFYGDFTPVAHLFHEYLGFAVRADSPVASGRDATARLRKDPGSMSISVGTSLGNTGHLTLALAVRAAGGDMKRLKTVVFASNGEAMTALLGGHVDAMVTSLSNLVRHVQAKTVRVVAISSPQRVAGAFSDVPTWREQEIDVVMSGWRGAIGPKGLNPAQLAYWEDVFARLSEAEEWKQELAKNHWHGGRMTSGQNREFLDQEYAKFRAVLADLGMAKTK
jgi:putative tricarboxylic transport membrane protein